MRVFPITIFCCPLSYFPNLTVFYSALSAFYSTCLSRGMPVWCVGKEEATSSAAFSILLFAAISYALQIFTLIFLYVGSEIESIFMHRENDLPPILYKFLERQ